MTATDLETIVPFQPPLDVEGIACRVRRMRTREALGLARIFGSGIGAGIMDLVEFEGKDDDEIAGQILALLLMVVPSAEEETVAFVSSIVVPVNDADAGRLRDVMNNPAVPTLLSVLGHVIDQEGEEFITIVGEARAIATKIGTLMADRKKPTVKKKAAGGGGRSHGRST